MTCPSGTSDAAYVLGALPPRERLEYERHLAGCESCARAVRDLAGMPGLLGAVDGAVLEEDEDLSGSPALPASLRRTLLAAVPRGRRPARRRLALVAAAAVLVSVPVTLAVTAALNGDEPPAAAPGSGRDRAAAPSSRALALTPVGEVPVRASVALDPVSWGTRLTLDCRYDTASVSYPLPHAVDYLLYVTDRHGDTERVGSWRSVDGRRMRFSAGTATDRADLESVQVRAPDGRVVLRLAL